MASFRPGDRVQVKKGMHKDRDVMTGRVCSATDCSAHVAFDDCGPFDAPKCIHNTSLVKLDAAADDDSTTDDDTTFSRGDRIRVERGTHKNKLVWNAVVTSLTKCCLCVRFDDQDMSAKPFLVKRTSEVKLDDKRSTHLNRFVSRSECKVHKTSKKLSEMQTELAEVQKVTPRSIKLDNAHTGLSGTRKQALHLRKALTEPETPNASATA